MRQIRTDLAMEAFQASGGGEIPGVRVNQWEKEGVTMTEVLVDTPEAARMMGKREGAYLTMDAPRLREGEPQARLALANLLGEEVARMLVGAGVPREDEAAAPILVVGLGNRMVTPDALGPMAVDHILVTRHMLRELPQFADERMRSVCAIAPGVLGVTGVESVEMVESLTAVLRPRAVICVDSLSARASARIGATVQITDTGIHPGSGVGNHRRALDRGSVGAPVIAIGMPTVIYAATLVRDAMEELDRGGDGEDEADEADEARDAALDGIEAELLACPVGEMIVTPREIDAMVKEAAATIAAGINRALQPELSAEEIGAMME